MGFDLREEVAYLLFTWHVRGDFCCKALGGNGAPDRDDFLEAAGVVLDHLGRRGLPVGDVGTVERWLREGG